MVLRMVIKKTIAELRAQMQAAKDKKESNKGKTFNNKDNDIYPFWQMKIGEIARVRLLPDLNQDNPNSFFVDKLEHKISINGKDRKIPCVEMYGEKCPICELSRAYYKSEGKKSENGKYYYRSKISLVRVLVLEDPLPPDSETGEKFEGKVKNTQFAYQLMDKINEQILDDSEDGLNLVSMPWDIENGYNFTIKKTPQGEYGNYSTGSTFSSRQSPIDPKYLDSLELIDLATLLPTNPGVDAVQQLLEAHLTGSSGHPEDGEGSEKSEKTEAATKSDNVATTKVVEEAKVEDVVKESVVEKVEAPVTTSDDSDEDDILAKIRKRNQAK